MSPNPSQPVPLPEAYRTDVLDPFRRQEYGIALPKFRELLLVPRHPKDEAALRANVLACLCELSRRGVAVNWSEASAEAKRYAEVLADEAADGWPVGPAERAFAAAIELADRLHADPATWIRELHGLLPRRFEPALLRALRLAVSRTALDYGRADHVDAAMALGLLFLELSSGHADLLADRVTTRTRLAELMAFRSVRLPSEAQRTALALLDEALTEDATDEFAGGLRTHLVQRGQVVEQIRRFEHDARSRLGGILAALSRIRRSPELPAALHRDFAAIERNLVALEAVNRLVMCQQGAGYQPVDLAQLCRETLQEHDLPPNCVETAGTLTPWPVDVGYTRLTLDNLIVNALEAYRRRGVLPPSPPMRLSVGYADGTLRVTDFAGGLSGRLPDPFLPHVSEKGIHEGAGLGLSQARRAMVLQGGSLTLATSQPADGATFVLRFAAHAPVEATP